MKRNLYLNNMNIEEALGKFLKALEPKINPKAETIEVHESLDRVTSQAIFALCNSPLYDSAAMDGIAVVSKKTIGARESNPVGLNLGEDYLVVDTGDPVPSPYDAVIMAEDLQQLDDSTLQIRETAAPWQHLRAVGEDIVKGEMILTSGHQIRPMDIGVLLSGGITKIKVIQKPKIAIYPTGTEMIEPGAEIKEGSIIESNSRMLAALVEKNGGIPQRFPAIPDDYDLIKKEIGKAVLKNDMVIINAGSSAGTEDYTVKVLEELGEVLVHGVAMKPGKPVILAIVKGRPVIGLPGYPVSAYLAYENFAAPVLELLSSKQNEAPPTIEAVLTRRLVSSIKHREYIRVKVGRVGERMVATPLARGAGAAMTLVRADGFCIIEQQQEGCEAGEKVNVVLNRSIAQLDRTVVSIGSHDLILDIIADMFPKTNHGNWISSTHVGSMGGLMALKKEEAHIAPIHLLDFQTGLYNTPIIKTIFSETPMAIIKGVGRTQGLMVKKGNPLNINKLADLEKGRFINRQRGAGTRMLLDYLLEKAGISTEKITGYEREAVTHMAVAAAVASKSADVGMGILSAALAMDLDFIPISTEEYDFAIPQKFLDLPQIKALIQLLSSKTLLKEIDRIGGYTTEKCGEVLLL